MPKTTLMRNKTANAGDLIGVIVRHNPDQDDLAITGADARGHIVVYIVRAIQLLSAENGIFKFRRLIGGENFTLDSKWGCTKVANAIEGFSETSTMRFV